MATNKKHKSSKRRKNQFQKESQQNNEWTPEEKAFVEEAYKTFQNFKSSEKCILELIKEHDTMCEICKPYTVLMNEVVEQIVKCIKHPDTGIHMFFAYLLERRNHSESATYIGETLEKFTYDNTTHYLFDFRTSTDLMIPALYAKAIKENYYPEKILALPSNYQNEYIELLEWTLSHHWDFYKKLLFLMADEIAIENAINKEDYYDLVYSLKGEEVLQAHFMRALEHENEDACTQLSLRMRSPDSGVSPAFAYYHEALRYYNKRVPNYEMAIKYAHKSIEHSSITPGEVVYLLLQLYADTGNISDIQSIVRNNRQLSFGYFQITYFILNAIIHSDETQKPQKKAIEFYLHDIANKKNTVKDFSSELYICQLINLYYNCLAELYNYFRNALIYYDYYDTMLNDIIEHSCNICMALKICRIINLFSNDILPFLPNADIKLDEIFLQSYRDTVFLITDRITKTFVSNSAINDFSVYGSLMLNYRVDNIDYFIESVNSLMADDESVLQNYIGSPNEIVLLAFIEESIRNCIDENVKAFVEQHYDPEKYAEKIKYSSLHKALSKKSRIAFITAEAMFEKTKGSDWGRKDAGMISLAYYRIVELEINERVVLPMVTENIINEYDKLEVSIPNAKTKFKEKWKSLFTKIKNIYEDFSEGNLKDIGLMLGELRRWFKGIKESDIPKDTLYKKLRKNLSNLLVDDESIDYFIEFLEKDLLSEEITNKYRNPPAHTRYLSYETACECREYVIEKLTKLLSFLKEPNE